MRPSLLVFAFLGSCALSTPALADSQSASMPVSAVIQNNCIVSASPLAFSSTNVTTVTSVEGTAQISINCTSSTAYTVDMDRGANAAGEQRRMVSKDGQYLDYQIFSDPSRTKVWGSSNQGVSDQSQGANRKDMIAYGRINAVSQETHSGVYRDTVTVTVSF